jgi:hypothetical protein
MTDEQETLQHEAAQIGLTHLSDEHLRQFAKAKAAADRMVRAIPRNLPMAEEPAHTFRASEEA